MLSILSLIQLYAILYNLDPKIVYSVAYYESSLNPSAIGAHGEVGLLQLTPKYLHLTKEQLLDPETNIREGCAYIQKIQAECPFKKDFEWLACYNLGTPKASKLQYPKLFPYYKNVMKIYRKQ